MPTPQQFGPYRVLSELGRGGMGTVYVGVHLESGAQVAIKTIPASALDERFLREGQLLARLNHRNIVRVHEADLEGNPAYLVQDLLPGPDLNERLRGGPLPVEEAITITIALARAVAHAHAQGVLHRDIKPENVVFDAHGAPVLIDFGLAQPTGEAEQRRLTATGEVLGTPNTMAPEQAQGLKETSTATDVYALGGLLYVLLTGQPAIAWRGSLLATLQAVLEEAPQRPQALRPQIPGPIERECLRALAKAPADRHPSAEAFAAALEAAAAGDGREGPGWPGGIGIALLGVAVLVGVLIAVLIAPRLHPDGGDRSAEITQQRARAAALLRNERVALRSAEVAALISATIAPDDACRVLSGLVALARGDVAAAHAEAKALAAPGEPPGCALRGALGAQTAQGNEGVQAALADLKRARQAGVRRWDLLAWSVRARRPRRAGFLTLGEARRALTDLAECERRGLDLPALDLDRAWAFLRLKKLDDASRLAQACRDPDLLLAVISALHADGRHARALAPAALLPAEPTPERTKLAQAVLATVDPRAFELEVAVPRLQLVAHLHPKLELTDPQTQGLIRALSGTPLTAKNVDLLVALADALPRSLLVTHRVFAFSFNLRSQPDLRRRLIPVALRYLRLTEPTDKYEGAAIEVCGLLNGVTEWDLGAKTARAALKRLAPHESLLLLRPLADALRHTGEREAAIECYERLIQRLPPKSSDHLRAQMDLGIMLFARPETRSRAVSLLLRYVQEARTPMLPADSLLTPSIFLYNDSLASQPIRVARMREVVSRILSIWPRSPVWQLRLAWAEHLDGNAPLAWRWIQQAVARLDELRLRHSRRMARVVRRLRALEPDALSPLGLVVQELGRLEGRELETYRSR